MRRLVQALRVPKSCRGGGHAKDGGRERWEHDVQRGHIFRKHVGQVGHGVQVRCRCARAWKQLQCEGSFLKHLGSMAKPSHTKAHMHTSHTGRGEGLDADCQAFREHAPHQIVGEYKAPTCWWEKT